MTSGPSRGDGALPGRRGLAQRRRALRSGVVLTLLGALLPLAPVRAGDKDRVPGADWHFWFHDGGNLYDEAYSSLKDCASAAKTWDQESPGSPIAFSCAKVSRRLLWQARWQCWKKEALACAWKIKLEKLLEEREEGEEKKERR